MGKKKPLRDALGHFMSPRKPVDDGSSSDGDETDEAGETGVDDSEACGDEARRPPPLVVEAEEEPVAGSSQQSGWDAEELDERTQYVQRRRTKPPKEPPPSAPVDVAAMMQMQLQMQAQAAEERREERREQERREERREQRREQERREVEERADERMERLVQTLVGRREGGSGERPVHSEVRMDDFTGDTKDVARDNFKSWLALYERGAQMFNYTETHKLFYLQVKLKGVALSYFNWLPEETQTDYDALTAALCERFRDVESTTLRYKTAFECKMKDGETMVEFNDRLKVALQRAASSAPIDQETLHKHLLLVNMAEELRRDIIHKVDDGTTAQQLCDLGEVQQRSRMLHRTLNGHKKSDSRNENAPPKPPPPFNNRRIYDDTAAKDYNRTFHCWYCKQQSNILVPWLSCRRHCQLARNQGQNQNPRPQQLATPMNRPGNVFQRASVRNVVAEEDSRDADCPHPFEEIAQDFLEGDDGQRMWMPWMMSCNRVATIDPDREAETLRDKAKIQQLVKELTQKDDPTPVEVTNPIETAESTDDPPPSDLETVVQHVNTSPMQLAPQPSPSCRPAEQVLHVAVGLGGEEVISLWDTGAAGDLISATQAAKLQARDEQVKCVKSVKGMQLSGFGEGMQQHTNERLRCQFECSGKLHNIEPWVVEGLQEELIISLPTLRELGLKLDLGDDPEEVKWSLRGRIDANDKGEEGAHHPPPAVKLKRRVVIPAKAMMWVPTKSQGFYSATQSCRLVVAHHLKGKLADEDIIGEKSFSRWPVLNVTEQPQTLDADTILGHLEPASDTKPNEHPPTAEQIKEHIDKTDLTAVQKEQLTTLLMEHATLFAAGPMDISSTGVVEHLIDTADAKAFKCAPRPVPYARRHVVTEEIQKMLKNQIIRPSNSPWASPIVLVLKADGSIRFCIDFRQLNSLTRVDSYPLPRVNDLVQQLRGAHYLTLIDLTSGYWQIRMAEEDKAKTAFVTFEGLYEFNVMPFGLVNAGATFQRTMTQVLEPVKDCCRVYVDDIVIFSQDFTTHQDHLKRVFRCLEAANLRMKLTKCSFAQPEIKYLGFIVSGQGRRPDPKKVKAIEGFERPVDVDGLRRFLGMTGYLRMFIPNMSTIALPLTNLLRTKSKKEPAAAWCWSATEEQAFNQLKSALKEDVLLRHPNTDADAPPYRLETDASDVGLGAIFYQADKVDGTPQPLCYLSYKLKSAEKNYSTIEKECYAVYWAVKQLKQYLDQRKCKVITDNQGLYHSIKRWREEPTNRRVGRWVAALQGYDLEFEHRPGTQNKVADALSRAPADEAHCIMLIQSKVACKGTPTTAQLPDWQASQHADPYLKALIMWQSEGKFPEDVSDDHASLIRLEAPNYVLKDNVLYKKRTRNTPEPGDSPNHLLYVPQQLRKLLLDELHAAPAAGHRSRAALIKRALKHYWWPRMMTDIHEFIDNCQVCMQNSQKQQTRMPRGHAPLASHPWQRMSVDVLHLPVSHSGNRYSIDFVDEKTRFAISVPTRDQKASTIAWAFITHVVGPYGAPSELVSDQGRAFMSHIIAKVCNLLGIRKREVSVWRPQANGTVERYHRTLLDRLRKNVTDSRGRDWDQKLPFAVLQYNSTVHSTTQYSPYYMLFGRELDTSQNPVDSSIIAGSKGLSDDATKLVAKLQKRLDDAWADARDATIRARAKNDQVWTPRVNSRDFRVGQQVFIRRPRVGDDWKLQAAYDGPFKIDAIEGTTAKIRTKSNAHRKRLHFDRLLPYD